MLTWMVLTSVNHISPIIFTTELNAIHFWQYIMFDSKYLKTLNTKIPEILYFVLVPYFKIIYDEGGTKVDSTVTLNQI